MIVAGERRWRAARLAGLATVPVIVHPGELSAADRLMLQLDENDGELRLRLLTAAALRVLTATPGQPAHRVLLLLDEFAALGRMQSVEEAIAYSRGYGVSIWMLTQDLAQLRDLYPGSWGTLLANVKVLQAFGTADQFTADYLSRLSGQATVRTHGSNRSRGSTSAGNWWLPHQQQSAAEQLGEAGRALLLGDEVRRMAAGRQLLFVSGTEPMMTGRVDYRGMPGLAGRGDPNPMYRRG
jgi:type IV secretion system protein VirD4